MGFNLETPEHLRTDIYNPVRQAIDGNANTARHICRLMPREHGKSEAASTWS